MKYGVKMQTYNDNGHWADLPCYNTSPVDINIAHKYCDEYNATSAKAHLGSIQRNTKYWVEEKL